MGREPGLDEREGTRQAGRAGIPLGWRPSEETSDVAHFLRLTKRYPDLASGIQRSIGLARDERQLRARHPDGVSPPPRSAWKADMGITIVQKSDLTVRKRDPRVALVLAGGAISGGGFKLGGLKAFDDFLVNKKTTDFDMYVGLSAGAFLAAPLASGVTPPEMMRSLEGSSEEFTQFGLLDFYQPNFREFVEKPFNYILDLAAFLPGSLIDLVAQSPALAERIKEPLRAFTRHRTFANLREILAPLGDALLSTRPFPFPLDYVPSGIFDNSSIERYLRHNLGRRHMPNSFKALYQARKRELYIVAMNLDSAERVVFGHDEDSSLTISESVQASTALPGFYRPARIRGVDYVDGGVRRTANIDVAIEHGADLIICYNPFRPFSNRVVRKYDPEKDEYVADSMQLADRGMLMILNQVLRTLLHSRLQLGLRQYQDDPNFKGDIILIEPTENDIDFFQMTPLAFWERRRAAQHGYLSVTQSIDIHYDMVRRILESYGILMTRKTVAEGMQRMQGSGTPEQTSDFLMREVPKRDLSVAKA
jgi:predicted acylesterase/phospholipase RssA